MRWTRLKDNPPPENGQYLCVNKSFGRRNILKCGYAKCLSEIHEYDFEGVKLQDSIIMTLSMGITGNGTLLTGCHYRTLRRRTNE